MPLSYNELWHLGEYEKGRILGSGTYGTVTKIKRKQCDKDYVIKKTNDEDKMTEALLEITVLKLLQGHVNIINICGYDYKINKVNIILPLMNQDLGNIVDQLDKNKYLKYFKQMITGIKQCHDYDIMHRDLKLNNIVYDEQNDILKIIDFGLSVPFQSINIQTDPDLANSFYYRPPECLISYAYQYNQSIDIWALGCIMYYMITKKMIIRHAFHQEALDDIFSLLGTPTVSTWPEFPNIEKALIIHHYDGTINTLNNVLYPYNKLILSCLTVNPNKRLTANELLNFIEG